MRHAWKLAAALCAALVSDHAAAAAPATGRMIVHDGSNRVAVRIEFDRMEADGTDFRVLAGEDWGSRKVLTGRLDRAATRRLLDLHALAGTMTPDPALRELIGSPDELCVHPWAVSISVPGLEARPDTGRASCPQNPFFRQAWTVGVDVLKALPPCDELHPGQHANSMGALARCTLLRGDLAQAVSLANAAYSEVLRSPDESDRAVVEAFFASRATIRWGSEARISGGGAATDFWRRRVRGRVVESLRAGKGRGVVTGWVWARDPRYAQEWIETPRSFRSYGRRVEFVEEWRLGPDGWRMVRSTGEPETCEPGALNRACR